MGAGVPLGVVLVSGLAIFLIYERRRRIKAEKTVVDTLAVRDTSENTQIQPREIYGGEVYEVGGTS